MDIKVTECPFCHGSEFIEGKMGGYAQLQSCANGWYSGELHHIICRRCGSVVRSFVKDPEKMLKKKDRKEN